MSETAPSERRAAVSRRGRPLVVSATALAQHLDCSRTNVHKLEAEGVLHREVDGFPVDQCRVAYIRFLRRERQLSPRREADTAHIAAKTEMLQLKLAEKRRELVRQSDVDDLLQALAGVSLTKLSSLPARCAPSAILRPGALSKGPCAKFAMKLPPPATGWPTNEASHKIWAPILSEEVPEGSALTVCGVCGS